MGYKSRKDAQFGLVIQLMAKRRVERQLIWKKRRRFCDFKILQRIRIRFKGVFYSLKTSEILRRFWRIQRFFENLKSFNNF